MKVAITGDGDQRERLEALSRSLGLEKVVQFLGFLGNERLAEEYARCNVWVNPSIIDERGDTEGLGVGAIEAYSYGKPVVSSNVGGIPDAVRHRITGLLVPEKDVQRSPPPSLNWSTIRSWLSGSARRDVNSLKRFSIGTI